MGRVRDWAEGKGLEGELVETEPHGDGSPYAGEPVERPPREQPTGRANRLAVTALICAAAIPFLLVAGVLGAVFGFVALDEIEESKGRERGRGMALWAIALGFVNIAVSCAVIALVVTAAV
jgi:hypothetical protein